MRFSQIDGLRFILFMLVFLLHQFPGQLEPFSYAVPAFFALSGFLITKSLINNCKSSASYSIKTFYIQRALRLFPAYYTFILIAWIIGALPEPSYYLAQIVNLRLFLLSLSPDAAAFKQYITNNWQSDYLHLWSLGAEEQFYLLYPFLFFSLTARRLQVALILIVALSILSRIWCMENIKASLYSVMLPVCMEYFAWGCFFSLRDERIYITPRHAVTILIASFITTIWLISLEFWTRQDGFYQFQTSNFQTPIALFMGLFVWGLWRLPIENPISRALSYPSLVFLGRISYGMYIFHLLGFQVCDRIFHTLHITSKLAFIAGSFIITFALSFIIWYMIETRCNRLRKSSWILNR